MNVARPQVSTPTEMVVDLDPDGSVPSGFRAVARRAAAAGAPLRVRLPRVSRGEAGPAALITEVHLRAVASAEVNAALDAAGVAVPWSLELG